MNFQKSQNCAGVGHTKGIAAQCYKSYISVSQASFLSVQHEINLDPEQYLYVYVSSQL